jgi:hypothetical protein
MHVSNCKLVELPKIHDFRGNLTFVQPDDVIQFSIARVYYLYDVPSGATRGGHGHKNLQQLIIALSGSFNVVLTDGTDTEIFQLNRPNIGLYVCPMIWRELENFSSGAVCLSIVSLPYDESDYYRNFDDYLQAVRELRNG